MSEASGCVSAIPRACAGCTLADLPPTSSRRGAAGIMMRDVCTCRLYVELVVLLVLVLVLLLDDVEELDEDEVLVLVVVDVLVLLVLDVDVLVLLDVVVVMSGVSTKPTLAVPTGVMQESGPV